MTSPERYTKEDVALVARVLFESGISSATPHDDARTVLAALAEAGRLRDRPADHVEGGCVYCQAAAGEPHDGVCRRGEAPQRAPEALPVHPPCQDMAPPPAGQPPKGADRER